MTGNAVTLPADHLGRAWLAVNTVTGTDKATPALCRTTRIELHPTGIRLIATDSHTLLHAWIPHDPNRHPNPPTDDTEPEHTATAHDPWGRAKSFIWHQLQLHAEADREDRVGPSLTLALTDPGANDPHPTLDGLGARWVTLQTDSETLHLRCYEGDYPNWRALVAGPAGQHLRIPPETMARLGKLERILPGSLLSIDVGAPRRCAAVRVDTAVWPIEVAGLLMPADDPEEATA